MFECRLHREGTSRGFTLIELLVVISIVALFASIVLAALSEARSRARIGKAKADLQQIALAIKLLEDDTNLSPGPMATLPCINTSLADPLPLDEEEAGILQADLSEFPGWDGPYVNSTAVRDAWGTDYHYYANLTCSSTIEGCESYAAGTKVRAVFSAGPDGNLSLDTDNIVHVICR